MKKRLTRVVAFLLAFLLIGTSQSISALANEYDYSKDNGLEIITLSSSCKNSVYYSEGGDEPNGYSDPVYTTHSSYSTQYDSTVTYETDYTDAVDQMRAAMVMRSDTIIYYKTTVSDISGLSDGLFASAVDKTNNPYEGDYLGYQWDGYTCNIQYYYQSPYYYVTFSYDIDYYTTYAQEQAFNTKLAQVISGFDFTSSTTKYQKIKTIYDYICDNITYDYDTLNDDSYTLKYTAYAALINNTAVCQGYAVLYYRMLREVGINARVVTGKGAGGNHAWNIVQLNQLYYLADSTWDAGNIYYDYFLKGSSDFSDHTLDNSFTTTSFKAAYPIPISNYDPNTQEVTKTIKSVTLDQNSYVFTGTAVSPKITVKDENGQTLFEGTEYTVSYSNNTKPGTGTLIVNGIGSIAGTITKNFTIIPGTTTLKGINNTEYGITINWSQVAGADSYKVYRKTSSTSWTQIASVAGGATLSYNDKTAASGTTYYYTVRAYGGGSLGGYNTTGLVMRRLTQPEVSSINNADKGISLKWTKVAGANGYYLYRRTGSGGWSRIATINNAYTLTFTDTTASAGINNIYTVRAYAGSYLSSYNNTGKSLIRLRQPEISAINLADGIQVKWTKVAGAEGYYIYRKVSGGSWNVVARINNGNTVAFTDKSAKDGITYIYTAKAYKGTYVSSYNSKGTTIKRLTQPGISVSNVSGGIRVNWSKVSGAAGYYVYRRTANQGWGRVATIYSGNTISYTDKSTYRGITYIYTVRAFSGSYVGSYNNTGMSIRKN